VTVRVIEGVRLLNAFRVMGLADLQRFASSSGGTGCIGSSCLIQGSGAEYLVEGSLGVVDYQYVLNLKLTDRKFPIVVSTVARRMTRDEKTLPAGVASAVVELFEPLRTVFAAAPAAAPPAPRSAPPDFSPVPAPLDSVRARVAPAPLRPWWISGFAAGGALAVTGAIFHVLAAGEASQYGSGAYLNAADQDAAEGRFSMYRALAITGYVAGGALVVAGAVMLILDKPPAGAQALDLVPKDGGALVTYGGRW